MPSMTPQMPKTPKARARAAAARPLRRVLLAGAVAAASLATGGCLALDVANTDTPALSNIFTNPANLENAVGLSFRVFWGTAQGARDNATFPVVQLGALGEVITGTAGSVFEVIQEPRIRYNNVDAGQWLARKPWYDLYEVIATNRDALRALDGGVKVGTITAAAPNGTDTPRARVFSRMMLGLSYIYLGMLYDQAYLADEKTADEGFAFEFRPYAEVSAFGIRQLELAIADARQAPTNFTLPIEWVNQQTINRDELVRVMNGYLARALVYTSRLPAERAQVNWARVIELTNPGNVITRDFGALADQTKSGTTSSWLQYTQLQTDGRIDNVLLGPADTSGTYQAWLRTPIAQRAEIVIRTPDRRVHPANAPTTRGKYFENLTTQTMSQARGGYVLSRYRGVRYGTQYWNTGFIPTMTPVEMDLLRAEAFIRTGRAADGAALINKTRTTVGELPPVTAAGTGTLPTCVPRKDDGSCGDLLDALLYEKRMELHSMEALPLFADWRAFGKLPRGSLMQLPVTGRELQTLGRPIYSFGGDLPGSSP